MALAGRASSGLSERSRHEQRQVPTTSPQARPSDMAGCLSGDHLDFRSARAGHRLVAARAAYAGPERPDGDQPDLARDAWPDPSARSLAQPTGALNPTATAGFFP